MRVIVAGGRDLIPNKNHVRWLIDTLLKLGTTEVIKAICKIKRFGLLNHHPDFPDKNNLTDVLDEISDLRYALDRYEDDLLKDRLFELRDENEHNTK